MSHSIVCSAVGKIRFGSGWCKVTDRPRRVTGALAYLNLHTQQEWSAYSFQLCQWGSSNKMCLFSVPAFPPAVKRVEWIMILFVIPWKSEGNAFCFSVSKLLNLAWAEPSGHSGLECKWQFSNGALENGNVQCFGLVQLMALASQCLR